MNLLLDIGNSQVKWVWAQATTLHRGGAFAYAGNPDWPRQLPRERPDAVYYGSVAAPAPAQALEQWAQSAWRLSAQRLTGVASACGVRNAYAEPDRLGVDRWFACIAAHHRGSGSVLVADAGTALTLDFVAADGQHRGGLICPGVGAMRVGIHGATRVRVRDYELPAELLATNTDAAVAAGTLHAALGLLDRIRAAMRPDRLLLTGGQAKLLAAHLDSAWKFAPQLVLEGLARVATEALDG